MRKLALVLASCGFAAAAQADDSVAASPHWTTAVSVSLKETYDDNVFLQQVTNLANQSSLVSSVSAALAASYPVSPLLNTAFTYSPEWSIFHSAHSEDNITHRAGATFTGKDGAFSYDWTSTLVLVDGSDQGLFFTGPGGAPAIGGIPTRDRRDATVYRSTLKAKWVEGDWMIRPVGTAYYHDFRTQHRTTPFYQNFVDRSEYVAGLDVGYQINKTTTAFLGYRAGNQTQAFLNGVNLAYGNTLQRIIAGLEGSPAPWIKLAVAAGPDFRQFRTGVAAGFHSSTTKFWSDSTITLIPSKADTITLVYKRLYLPAFGGRNIYEDITAEAQWKHVFNPTLSGALGVKDYSGFFELGNRRDSIYTYSGSVAYKWDKLTTVEGAYSYDTTQCNRPGVDVRGREFTRNLVSVSLKRTF